MDEYIDIFMDGVRKALLELATEYETSVEELESELKRIMLEEYIHKEGEVIK